MLRVQASMQQASDGAGIDGYHLISKMLNLRDNLQQQIFQACLYRKLLVWHDLNIHPEEYCTRKVVDCIQLMNDYQDKHRYKPTKL